MQYFFQVFSSISRMTGGAGQEVNAAYWRGIESADEQLSRWLIELTAEGWGWGRGEGGKHVDLHFIPVGMKERGDQSSWRGEGFMISSALMDGCYLQCVIVFCCCSYLIFDTRTAAGTGKHSLWWKPPMVKNVIYPPQQTGNVSSNIGWIPSSGTCVEAVSVYLSYELYSLLCWYLRASDQQFAGRLGELSDREERGRDGAA